MITEVQKKGENEKVSHYRQKRTILSKYELITDKIRRVFSLMYIFPPETAMTAYRTWEGKSEMYRKKVFINVGSDTLEIC